MFIELSRYANNPNLATTSGGLDEPKLLQSTYDTALNNEKLRHFISVAARFQLSTVVRQLIFSRREDGL